MKENLKSLNEEMAQRREEFLSTIPADIRKIVLDEAQKLARSGITRKAVQVGMTAPDFLLPEARGRQVRLSERWREGPVVLSFYRGGWCPYCNLQLSALQRVLPDIHATGANLIAVSPQSPDNSLSTAEKLHLAFDVLSDREDRVAREYGLVFEVSEPLRNIYRDWGIDLPSWNKENSWELPVPATYVIDRNSVVVAAHIDTDYTRRMEPSDILSALTQMGR